MSAARKHPTLAIVLILVACIRFEYRTSTWEIIVPGLIGGLVVLGIVAIVVCHKIFVVIEQLLRTKKLLTVPLNHRYDILVPVAIFAVMVKIQYFGSTIVDMHNQDRPRWEFHWSDRSLDVNFILAVIGLVGLLRIYDLLRGLIESDKTA